MAPGYGILKAPGLLYASFKPVRAELHFHKHNLFWRIFVLLEEKFFHKLSICMFRHNTNVFARSLWCECSESLSVVHNVLFLKGLQAASVAGTAFKH